MTIEDVLSLISSHGFLSPQAARFEVLGPDRLVFITALPYGPGAGKEPGVSAAIGSIAPFAQRNYYRAAVLQLKGIVGTLITGLNLSKRETSIFCNSRLPEKAMAAACGVGHYGKNGIILVPGAGSLCILAGFSIPYTSIVSSRKEDQTLPPLSLERDLLAEAMFPLCGACTACIEKCPTGALSTPGSLDPGRCIQKFTAEKTSVPEEIMEKWGRIIYGCQHCQEVCPRNRDVANGFETREGDIGSSLKLLPLLSGGTAEIRRRVRGTVMDRKWIHPEALLRNVLIAAGNSREPRLATAIERYLEDPRLYIRDAALWAYRKTTSTES
jgi:epoxyqueuosine reductase